MTDIIMVTWHRPEITELTIRTIRRNTKPENHRLVVIDNGSPAGMQDMLYQLHENGLIDQLVLNKENIGLEPARNQGLALVQSEWFVCADNDCLPEPMDETDWLEKLVAVQQRHPEFVSIACRTQVMIGTGNIFEGHEDEDLVEFPHPGGSLRLMNTELVKHIGGWRDEVSGRGSEERYIGAKIVAAGYKSAFAVHVRCLHLFGLQDSDRWGYDKEWNPEDTGHSDVFHPALENGDIYEEVVQYTDEELAKGYFNEKD